MLIKRTLDFFRLCFHTIERRKGQIKKWQWGEARGWRLSIQLSTSESPPYFSCGNFGSQHFRSSMTKSRWNSFPCVSPSHFGSFWQRVGCYAYVHYVVSGLATSVIYIAKAQFICVVCDVIENPKKMKTETPFLELLFCLVGRSVYRVLEEAGSANI